MLAFPSSYSVVSSPRYQTLPHAILRVPVVRVLDHLAVLADDVVHDGRLDPEDRLRPVGDGDDDPLDAALAVGLAVDPPASRSHRPVGVVDRGHEVGGLEGEGLAALGKVGADGSPSPAVAGRPRPAPRPRRTRRGRGAPRRRGRGRGAHG